LILLLTSRDDESPEEMEEDRRRELVKVCIREMQTKYRWAIPSAVVAELGRDGTPEAVILQLGQSLGRFRVLALNYRAACIAARIASRALKERPPGNERGAVKYDALICATAIAHAAECIVTVDRDYTKHAAAVGSSLRVVMPTEVPDKGQLNILHIKRSR
jgi:predicted nucleic acid-binding protein